MNKEEINCPNCEAEYYIEHDQDSLHYCPFCGDDVVKEEELEIEEDWEE